MHYSNGCPFVEVFVEYALDLERFLEIRVFEQLIQKLAHRHGVHTRGAYHLGPAVKIVYVRCFGVSNGEYLVGHQFFLFDVFVVFAQPCFFCLFNQGFVVIVQDVLEFEEQRLEQQPPGRVIELVLEGVNGVLYFRHFEQLLDLNCEKTAVVDIHILQRFVDEIVTLDEVRVRQHSAAMHKNVVYQIKPLVVLVLDHLAVEQCVVKQCIIEHLMHNDHSW